MLFSLLLQMVRTCPSFVTNRRSQGAGLLAIGGDGNGFRLPLVLPCVMLHVEHGGSCVAAVESPMGCWEESINLQIDGAAV